MKFRLLLIICLFQIALPAQKDTICPVAPRLFVGASVHYGFLWSHRYNMGHLVRKHITAFEVDISRISPPDRCWQKPYHYPQTGLAIHVIPLGNPEQLGTAIGVYPYVNFPLGNARRAIKTNLRLGYGLGYITRSFDPLENHKNVAIGSHLNACISLRLIEMWELNEKSFIELGLGLTHFSNGAARLPNLGLNIPFLNVGFHHSVCQTNLCYKTSPEADAKRNAKLARTTEMLADKSWHINVLLVTGFNDIDPPGGKRYGLLNIHSSIMKRTATKHRWGAGIDLMYSDAIRTKLALNDVRVSPAGNLQPGAKICYELVIGRLSLPFEMGAYLYTRYKLFGPVYNRFAIHYLAGDHLLINISLKTHFARAEYIEYGLGWKF
ncbi:MAG: acyloxyacyl hydrolase [Bacteroidota bacterium]|nr:acyloxyacyl hydrolase [Bacteroidota bacterium]